MSPGRRASKRAIETMIWLSIVSFAAGVLLAYRFNIMVLMPATLVVVAAGAGGLAQIEGVWSILLLVGAASVGIQTGYFVGMLIQLCVRTRLTRRSSCFARARWFQ